MGKKSQLSGKNRKYGRNADECKAYRLSGRREKNKIARIERHLKKFPDDVGAKKAMEALKGAS